MVAIRLCNKCEYWENPQSIYAIIFLYRLLIYPFICRKAEIWNCQNTERRGQRVQSHVMTPVRVDRAAAVGWQRYISGRRCRIRLRWCHWNRHAKARPYRHPTYPDQMPLTLFQTKPAISPAIDVCKMVSVEPPCKGASKDTLIKAADSVQHSYSCKLLGVLTLIPPCSEYYIFHPRWCVV